MQVFQDLKLSGQRNELERLIAAISAMLPQHGWQRDLDAEKQLATATRDPMYSFACKASMDREAASLWLAYSNSGDLEVANIVPEERNELSVHQYNSILNDFWQRFVQPAMAGLNINAEITKSETSIEDYLSKPIADLLRRFSNAANKSTGSIHPLDRKRWFSFLIAAHTENTTVSTDILRKWLIEEGGWSDDKAFDLVVEYEYGRELLSQYDRSAGVGANAND